MHTVSHYYQIYLWNRNSLSYQIPNFHFKISKFLVTQTFKKLFPSALQFLPFLRLLSSELWLSALQFSHTSESCNRSDCPSSTLQCYVAYDAHPANYTLQQIPKQHDMLPKHLVYKKRTKSWICNNFSKKRLNSLMMIWKDRNMSEGF